jgi:hypothetical protein
MTPMSLNNGIFTGDVQASIGSDISTYSLLEIASKFGTGKRDDMGPVDLFIDAQKIESPLYQFSSFGGKNVEYVKNERGEFTWQRPVTEELPFVVGDVDPTNVTKGIDGQVFKIKFNKRFGHTAKLSYGKMNGFDVIVTQEDIIPTGDGYVHTVRPVNNDSSRYLDNQFLKAGTRWFHASSSGGEFDQKYDSVQATAGYQEYYNFVGNSMATFEYTVGTTAAKMLDAGINVPQSKVDLMGIWKVNDQSLRDPSIANLNQLKGALGGEKGLMKAVKDQRLDFGLVTKIEAKGIQKIANDIEYDLMWGKGGIITTDGAEVLRESVGLWNQLNNSFTTTYNSNIDILELIESEINNFYMGKVDLVGPDPKRTIIVQTGKYGLKKAGDAIQRKALGTGLVTESTEIGAISGSNPMELHYGFSFTSFVIPYLANVKFVYNPALDPIYDNDIDNPIIDGYRLSSGSYIVFDITDQGSDNIKLMKQEWDNELRHWYLNGKFDAMGRRSGFQSSGGNYGYKCMFEQKKQAIWVKDATKVLKIVRVNPKTGGHL